MHLKLTRHLARRSPQRPHCYRSSGRRYPNRRAPVAHSLSSKRSTYQRKRVGVNARRLICEAMLWTIGAIVLRLILNVIMAASSQFWLFGVVVACLPAVTAIWMTHLSPQQGFVLGYRCLLVMTGLLLGGKLGGFS